MNKSISFGFLGLITIVLAVSSFLGEKQEATTLKKLENVINAYVDSGVFVNPHGETLDSEEVDDIVRYYYSSAVSLLNEEYGFSFKGWAINEIIDDEYVNVYFFREDPKGALSGFKGNCTYTGYRNIIICDSDFALNRVANYDEFDKHSKGESRIILPYIRHVLLWVVGHEIGHLAHRHSGKQFNFDGNSWNGENIIAALDHASKEREADEFAVDALRTWQVGHYLWMGLSQLAANPNDFGGELQEDGAIVVKNKSRSHDPIFLRILDMAIIGIDKGLIIDSTGHFERLRERVEIKE